jgi:hypothetical protein
MAVLLDASIAALSLSASILALLPTSEAEENWG